MLKIVYQDCALCGSRKEWGEKTIKAALAAGLEIQKISFASPEGSHLCKEAILAGIGSLPFITNGLKFSKNIEDFIPKPEEPKKTTKKRKSAKKTQE